LAADDGVRNVGRLPVFALAGRQAGRGDVFAVGEDALATSLDGAASLRLQARVENRDVAMR
jgi:hypothetical protein